MFEGKPLAEEVIIVTGGGSGLGKSMTERFSELGATVVITSRTQEKLEKAASEISEKTGGEIFPISSDVRNADRVGEVVEKVVEKYGRITSLVNNAAGNFLAPTEKLSPNGFKAVVDIVLYGTFHYTLAVGKHMIDRGEGGNILNIVTTYAWTGSSFVVPSACGKAGVLAMTRSLAVEWADHKIRVNAIAPGPFPTEGAWEKLMPKNMEEVARNKIPLRRFGEHPELTNLASYLLTDYSAFMTGECVTIDGGEWLMGGEFNFFTMNMNPQQRNQVFEMMKEEQKKKSEE